MSVARTLQIELEVCQVSVPEGPSPEGQARHVRYAAFERSIGEDDSLLTAHTLDDNAETILTNLLRGAGGRGLTGIPYERPPSIYRPALALTRAETREIAALAGLAFYDDPMNQDLSLTRNWVRHELIPRMQEMNPQLASSLARTAGSIARDVDYLEDLADGERPDLVEGASRHPVGRLVTTPRPVADRVLILMLTHVAGRSAVTSGRIDRLWAVVRGEVSSQELGGGAAARLDGAMLVVEQARQGERTGPVRLTPGVHDTGAMTYEVRQTNDVCRVLPLSKWVAIFPKETVLVASGGVVNADGEPAWVPGERRLPVAWYRPGETGYLSVLAREGTGWTSSR